MRVAEARELGAGVAQHLQRSDRAGAYTLLAPLLAQRTPFRLLDLIGAALGRADANLPLGTLDAFLDQVAAGRTEGGWVVIGSALGQRVNHDLAEALARCRAFVRAGDVWFAADILAERVPGPALVGRFPAALAALSSWRDDSNRWVRRAVGVAVHFWAKRSRGAVSLASEAESLLQFLAPMFGEWEMDAVKGVGWGLKTLGKHYPDLLAQWLEDFAPQQRRHRALMLRKALTYLPPEQRARALGGPPA
jgi:3-methyladenine DNA glycosylase AlkD